MRANFASSRNSSGVLAGPQVRAYNLAVTARGRFARMLRTWVRLACVYVTLAVIAAPSALGAAMGPVLRELGASQEHVCKCGMPQGKCGCPECALLDMERPAGQAADAASTVKRRCDGDASPVPLTATAAAIIPPRLHVLPASPVDPGLRFLPCTGPASPDVQRSTPPPRRASV